MNLTGNYSYKQGSYRILTVVFQTFPGQNYIKFQDFPYFSRICTNPV